MQDLQGLWHVVSAMDEGEDLTENLGANIQFDFEFNRLDVTTQHGVETFEYVIFSEEYPKWIELKKMPEEEPSAHKGLYKLQGDRLTLVLPNEHDEGRSTKFESNPQPSTNNVLVVLQRGPATQPATAPATRPAG